MAKQMIMSAVTWEVLVGVLLAIYTFALFAVAALLNMNKMYEDLGVWHFT
jgi:hypothetical protein